MQSFVRVRSIVDEFRSLLRTTSLRQAPTRLSLISVFSGPARTDDSSWPRAAYSEEAIDRVFAAAALYRELAVQGRSLRVLLNVAKEQRTPYEVLALEAGIPASSLDSIVSGERYVKAGMGLANTKTQAIALRQAVTPAGAFPLVITSLYHVPRTARAVERWYGRPFLIAGVPIRREEEMRPLIKGEVRRIQLYSDKGDIARDWDQAANPFLGVMPQPEIPNAWKPYFRG